MYRQLVAFILLFMASNTAHASPEWPDGGVRASTGDYIAVPALLAIALSTRIFENETPPDIGPHLNGFDTGVRSGLRLRSLRDRQTAGLISDILFYGMIGAPVVMDVGVVALGMHRDPDLAWQILWTDLAAISLATVTSVPVLGAIGRERPREYACQTDPTASDDCGSPNELRSFYSGHTSLAVSGAGLVCATHMGLDLLEGPWDEVVCGVAVAAGTTTGVLRLAADAHWASDVLVGFSIGAAIGLGVPLSRMANTTVTPTLGRQTVGLAGRF